MPELIRVVPPTPRPMGTGMAVLPKVTVAPPWRYICFIICAGRPLKSLRVKYWPSSTSSTAWPRSASAFAIGAPPAPVPTTTTSHSSVSPSGRVAASSTCSCQRARSFTRGGSTV